MTPTLLTLIERLEAASGPSRELDVLICVHVLGYRDIHGDGTYFDRGNDGYWTLDGDENNAVLPRFTSSIDAALTLVPEGYEWTLMRTDEYSTAELGDPLLHMEGEAKTPPLALCIAALKSLVARRRALKGEK